jgi:hypothetical protein
MQGNFAMHKKRKIALFISGYFSVALCNRVGFRLNTTPLKKPIQGECKLM